eukprot:6176126-Pleurochrysis_carterae.AAC.3
METHESVKREYQQPLSLHVKAERTEAVGDAAWPFRERRLALLSQLATDGGSAVAGRSGVGDEVSSPEKLFKLIDKSLWHQYSAGCAKLHLKMEALLGYKILVVQPPFRAYFRRAATSRITLLIEFKLLVMHETG